LSAPFRFASDFRQRLNQLVQDVLHASGVAGEAGRRGGMPGQVEFKDYRAYVPGDDLRFLDWNVFLRSGSLAVKTFTQDAAPEALVILDRSASMGPPSSRQDVLAREIAAAMGFLALRAGGDAILRSSGGKDAGRRHRGARSAEAWIAEVEAAAEPAGGNDLDVFERLAAPPNAGRVAVWISDFLAEPLPAPAFAALAQLASKRVAFVVCAHDDVFAHTPAGDAITLRDLEADRKVAAQNDAPWRAALGEVRADHVAAVTALAVRHRCTAVAVSIESTFEDCVLRALQRT
jgi:uncharacterized protein (DUF58 family)